jgi:hypothetical protein
MLTLNCLRFGFVEKFNAIAHLVVLDYYKSYIVYPHAWFHFFSIFSNSFTLSDEWILTFYFQACCHVLLCRYLQLLLSSHIQHIT